MSYQKLEVWQRAIELSVAVYGHTKSFPKSELYGLTSQLRRSSVSVPSNIAEGKGRKSDREYRQFLLRARGSLLELETQIHLASRLEFLDTNSAAILVGSAAEVGRLLNGLIRYLDHALRNGQLRGFKSITTGKTLNENPMPDAR